jgi:hypothetical protein
MSLSLIGKIAAGSTAKEAIAETASQNVFPEGNHKSLISYISYKKDSDNKEIGVFFLTNVKDSENKPRRLYISFNWSFLSKITPIEAESIFKYEDMFEVTKNYPDLLNWFMIVWETGMMKADGTPRYRPNALIGRETTLRVRHNKPTEGKYAGRTFAQTAVAFIRSEDKASPQYEVDGGENGFKIGGEEFTIVWNQLFKIGVIAHLIKLREKQNLAVAEDGTYDLRILSVTERDSIMLVLAPSNSEHSSLPRTVVYLNPSRDEQADTIEALVSAGIDFLKEKEIMFDGTGSGLAGLVFKGELGHFESTTGNSRIYQTLEAFYQYVDYIPTEKPVKPEPPRLTATEPTTETTASTDRVMSEADDELDDPFAE